LYLGAKTVFNTLSFDFSIAWEFESKRLSLSDKFGSLLFMAGGDWTLHQYKDSKHTSKLLSLQSYGQIKSDAERWGHLCS